MLKDNVKHILVIGLGFRTGLATANFLADKGYSVTVSDSKSEEQLGDLLGKVDSRVEVVTGSQEPALLDKGCDLVVLSPGVPQRIALVQEALKRQIPVISEIELASYYIKGYTIAITGTDGKSTTTALTAHVLEQLGMHTLMGGNIGIPLISLVDRATSETVTVIELSSYQLETIRTFRPDVAAVLNITPDHLDRYDGMDAYADAKFNVTANQSEDDCFIYNEDDSMVVAKVRPVKARLLSFSLRNDNSDSVVVDGLVKVKENGRYNDAFDPAKLFILGSHNIYNAMAACLMVRSVLAKMKRPVDQNEIASALYSFKGLEHRMEITGEYEGRTFINDSKATTVNAVEMAVNSLQGNVVLILGGRTKGDDYSRLAANLRGKIKSLVLIGESRDEFRDVFAAYKLFAAEDMERAVLQAMKVSETGDVILLSPACASFDMYNSFEERGSDFKQVYSRIASGELNWT